MGSFLVTAATAGAAIGTVVGGLPGAIVGAGVGATGIAAYEVVRGVVVIGGVTYRFAKNVAEVYHAAKVDGTDQYMSHKAVELDHRENIMTEVDKVDDGEEWVVLSREGGACGRCGVVFEEVHECTVPVAGS